MHKEPLIGPSFEAEKVVEQDFTPFSTQHAFTR